MRSYICLILGPGPAVLQAEPFEAADDAAALDHAMSLKLRYPAADGYELWRRGCKIGGYQGPGTGRPAQSRVHRAYRKPHSRPTTIDLVRKPA